MLHYLQISRISLGNQVLVMDNSQVDVVVENGKEKAARNTDSSKRWPTMKEITDPKGPFFPKWRMIFIVSCLFAVLLDPLFLYIPMINDDAKCMSLDRNLKIAAPVFRMVTDVFYILNIILQVYKSKKWLAFINAFRSGSCSSVLSNLRSISPSIAKTMWKSYILIDVFAVLPLPQVVILIFFSKMRGVRSLNTRKLLSFLVLVQYVPRVLRIYLSCKEPKKSSKEEIATWVKGVLNFFMYILASHSGILGSTDYPKKLSNCFWWGLRNLSSLGSNLQTSTNTWENLFATLISIIGLLLFLYLIGNLQMYMQTDAAILESNRHKRKVKRAVEKKGRELDLWLLKNGIPSRRKNEMMERVQQELAERRNVDVENILSILPEELQSYIKNLLPLARLKKVPLLQTMDEEVLKEISEYLEPKKFEITGREYLSRDGEPLEKMIFIVEGDLGVERRNVAGRDLLYPGDFYGAELLEWVSVSNTSFPATLPLSIDSSYVTNNDSVLFLKADDLKSVVSKFRSRFSKEITLPSNFQPEVLTSFQLTRLKTVPMFQATDEALLKAITERLKPVTYTDGMYIIKKDEPLQLMFFVLAGYVVTESYPHFVVRIGEFCGQELLDWPSTTSFPMEFPTALESARANGDVRVLALMLGLGECSQ
ncbi:cyclic nucleotide-gated ion channel 1 isoform X2 [Rosa chinensis]|uniref:cyclic nucleotide-gated ion channel 1 isoform X2 n=1 Tax=Rosa chinensis TaxID=74649 RepID=UPI001AD90FF2|nr:cyclic nucleotide-gated ion channel 1 isoform X2 [Rosa chinensis]